MTIIDFHVHLFEKEITEVNGIPTKTSKEQIRLGMEEAGIDLSVLLVMAPKNDIAKTKGRNDWLATICRGERKFEGFGSVHPEDGKDAINEMKRCVNDLGLKGFKLHPNTQQFDCGEPGLIEVMKQAAELDVPIIIDTYSPFDDNQPSKLLKAVFTSPETKVCFAHVGMWRYMDFGIYGSIRQRMAFDENVYFDLSASCVMFYQTPFQEQFRWITEQLGGDRLIFGSDFPLYLPKQDDEYPPCTPKYSLDVVRNFGYPKAWVPNIIGGNAAKLLKLQ